MLPREPMLYKKGADREIVGGDGAEAPSPPHLDVGETVQRLLGRRRPILVDVVLRHQRSFREQTSALGRFAGHQVIE